MDFSSVKLVYFSPTGTTKKILEGIAQGISVDPVEHVSLTLPDAAVKTFETFNDDLVLIGSPVYAGRLPDDTVKRLKRLQGRNTAAVLVVAYGNRAYEDALLELTNLAEELGFVPIAAAAFIGEHSFSAKDAPIAEGRPDNKDTEKAIAFGSAIKRKLSDLSSLDAVPPLQVPGNFPYKEDMAVVAGAAETRSDICILCGACAAVCPKDAITVSDVVETDESLCIKCRACVKECPTNARFMDIPLINKITAWLRENYTDRKEPEVFM